MNRIALCAGVMALVLGCASQVACRKPKGSTMSLTVEEWAPATGANRLYASPNGRWLAAEYFFGSEKIAPLVKVIDRETGALEATARGALAGRPDDSGETYYVAGEGGSHTLRSTARPGFAVALAGAPRSDFVEAYRTAGRVIVAVGEKAQSWLGSIDLAEGALGRTRVIASDPQVERRIATHGGSLPALFVSVWTPKAPPAGPRGYVTALDETTLEERWRAPWKPAGIYEHGPGLGLSGNGALVVAFASNALQMIDSSTGATAGYVSFVGPDLPVFGGAPGRHSVLALRYNDTQRAGLPLNDCDVVEVELPSGKTSTLWNLPRRDRSCPHAFAVAGGRVLLAPGSPPRFPHDRSTWGPEVLDYVK